MAKNHVVSVHLESTAFPAEGLRIRELRGREEVSQLFSFDVAAIDTSGRDSLSGAEVASKAVSLVFTEGHHELRRVHGMVATFGERLDRLTEHRFYRMRIVPSAYRLSLVDTSEVFLDLSVPDIIGEKLGRVGLNGESVEMRLSHSYPKRPYVLQYKETDLAFVSRLAEHEGISFHFVDHEGHERIVFTDDNTAFSEHERPLHLSPDAPDRVWDFHVESHTIPAAYLVSDYDDENPALDISATKEVAHGYGGGVVEYAPNYRTPAEGARLAAIRAEGLECRRITFHGQSSHCGLSAGCLMSVEEFSSHHHSLSAHPHQGRNEPGEGDDPRLLVVSMTHALRQAVGELGADLEVEPYVATFTALRAEVPYRSERRTPRPRVEGLLVGFVVDYLAEGPYGAVDAAGKYSVRIHIDTAPHPSKQSLPVRMVQAHAGAAYGAHSPLRPGTEVMVGFLGGDPDRPVIVGAVPNARTPSPVTSANAQINKILRTETGIVIEARDLYPPKRAGQQQGPGA